MHTQTHTHTQQEQQKMITNVAQTLQMCSHGGKQNKQSDQTKCYIEKSAWDQACDDDENSLCVCVCDVRMFGAFVSFFIRYVYNNFPVSILIVRILLLFSIKLSIASAMQ